ncbi:hypothetical protein [Vibrio sp. D431a]|uniref:hypothetical protein n=1 Tax=Vibrio sp. D431a TaxID=2837388 RepID=UPI002552C081|nr:hypothetical protein [Vibrio sp. D431a]MDK9789903.1 hypothetical protein [Vibrio sp. D431a]
MAKPLFNSKNGNPVPSRPVVTREIIDFTVRKFFKELNESSWCIDDYFCTEFFINSFAEFYVKYPNDSEALAKIVVSDFCESAANEEKWDKCLWEEISDWEHRINCFKREVKELNDEIIEKWDDVYKPLNEFVVGDKTQHGVIVAMSRCTPSAYIIKPWNESSAHISVEHQFLSDGQSYLVVLFENANKLDDDKAAPLEIDTTTVAVDKILAKEGMSDDFVIGSASTVERNLTPRLF